jgi:cupin fold WbuC family metalloprotein
MDFIRETDEVYRSRGPITQVTADDIAFLKTRAASNPRRRVRLCAHQDSEDRLHEMLIVHAQAAYVPPHKHLNKSESFHIIEGLLTVFLFSDEGVVVKVIPMGGIGSGRVFYYRLSASFYHTVWPESEFVVFHEVTNGPFDRKDTINASWAPAEDDLAGQPRFTGSLLQTIKKD